MDIPLNTDVQIFRIDEIDASCGSRCRDCFPARYSSGWQTSRMALISADVSMEAVAHSNPSWDLKVKETLGSNFGDYGKTRVINDIIDLTIRTLIALCP